MRSPATAGEGPEADARFEGPIADEGSREADYRERSPDPPGHMHVLPWATFQAFDPAQHTAEDRWRVAMALRDALGYGDVPHGRREAIAQARAALDAAAALRRAGDRREGPDYVLALLGLPADYYARVDAEEEAFRAKPQKPCSCGWGSPGHVPMLRPIEGGLAELEALEAAHRPPPVVSYLELAADPQRPPIERALARAVVEKPDRYSDEDFDVALVALTAALPLPEFAEDAVQAFAVAWLEGARHTPRDFMGNHWAEAILLSGHVARGKHPAAREFAERLVQHFFATHYTYAFTAEDLRDGRMPKLAQAADWPALLAAARAKRPDAPESDWKLVAEASVKCVGAPTVDDVVDRIDGYAGDARRRTWHESMARTIRWQQRVPPIPRRVPGRCVVLHHRTVDGRPVTELCPNPATTTDDLGRSVCPECAEFTRKLGERNDRAMAESHAAYEARRKGLPGWKPTPPPTLKSMTEATRPKLRRKA